MQLTASGPKEGWFLELVAGIGSGDQLHWIVADLLHLDLTETSSHLGNCIKTKAGTFTNLPKSVARWFHILWDMAVKACGKNNGKRQPS